MRSITVYISKVLTQIEEAKVPFPVFFASLLSLIVIRSFLELFFSASGNVVSPQLLHHWTSFYVCSFLSSIILLTFFSKEKVEKVSKIVLVGFAVVIIPPVIEHFTGSIVHYNYVFNSHLPISHLDWTMIGTAFFSFYSNAANVMLGQKIELFLFIVLSSSYIFIKTRSILKTALTAFGIYMLEFFFMTFPNYVSFGGFPEVYDHSHWYTWEYFASLFSILILAQVIVWLYFYDKKITLRLVKNLLRERSVHYLAFVWFGCYLAGVGLYTILLSSLCIILLWQANVAINDVFDVEGDTFSKKINPIVEGTITSNQMSVIALACILLSVFIATFLSYSAAVIAVLYIALSLLYSIPPFRLKKLPVISIGVIAAEILLAFTLGFYSEGTEEIFPAAIASTIFFCFFFAAHTKDLKDYEGDKNTGVLTIPVLFGLERGRTIIGVFNFIAYLLVPFMLGMQILIIPALVFGILTFFVVRRPQSKEWQIFLLYFLYLAIVFFFVTNAFSPVGD